MFDTIIEESADPETKYLPFGSKQAHLQAFLCEYTWRSKKSGGGK